MTLPLEEFYERELQFLEETARPFSRRYPAQAGHLQLPPGSNADPHLERFIEGIALLAGRVRHKVDTDLPELIESLQYLMYPHLSLILPSMAILKVEPEAATTPGQVLPAGALVHGRPFTADHVPCQYRLGYPVTVWPVEVNNATWQPVPLYDLSPPPRTAAALRLEVACSNGRTFADLGMESLRLHLAGERQMVALLYEAFFLRCQQVLFRSLDHPELPPIVCDPGQVLRPVGLDQSEGLLPFPAESFPGYRLLMEILSFPAKFHFVDLSGFRALAGFGGRVEVVFFFDTNPEVLERGLSVKNFLTHCTAVINLFAKSCEPVDVHQLKHEYRVMPARRMPLGMEVYAVDSVSYFDPLARQLKEFRRFYAYDFEPIAGRTGYYYSQRRPASVEGDYGTDVFLTLVDPEFDPKFPSEAVLDVRATCTNRDLPGKFQQAGDQLLPLSGLDGFRGRFQLLTAPTQCLRPPLRRSTHWRLLSQNCLNHLSLAHPKEGVQSLRELLRLCDFSKADGTPLAQINRQLVEGIASVRSRPASARFGDLEHLGQARGLDVLIEFDEQKYRGVGVFLFASVMERFLGLFTAINSFVQLSAKTTQGEGILKKWPPRSGERQLI